VDSKIDQTHCIPNRPLHYILWREEVDDFERWITKEFEDPAADSVDTLTRDVPLTREDSGLQLASYSSCFRTSLSFSYIASTVVIMNEEWPNGALDVPVLAVYFVDFFQHILPPEQELKDRAQTEVPGVLRS